MAPPDVSSPGVSKMTFVAAVAIAAVLSIAIGSGAVFWLARSGRLPQLVGAASAHPATLAIAAAVVPKTHPLVLEPILANLADPGGSAYLRVSITLRVFDEVLPKGEKPKEEKVEKGKPVDDGQAAVRDVALDAIGRMNAQELLETDGKERLKRSLSDEIKKHVPELKVSEIFFTEFLVQQ